MNCAEPLSATAPPDLPATYNIADSEVGFELLVDVLEFAEFIPPKG